jgi:NADPH:quinone reductase-like Zn-dependent oxidoreductase
MQLSPLTNTMQALVFNNTGIANEVLQLTHLPIPEPGKGEARIKIMASTIQPADMLFMAGKYRMPPILPQIAGLEGVGIIDKIGEHVTLPLHTLVAFRHKNIWAEYAIIPEEKLIPLPADFPIEKGAQMALNPVTAYALLAEAHVKPGDWLLLTAGNSAVAKITIQLAHSRRLPCIAVVRNAAEIESLQALGAAAVLLSDSPTLAADIQTITHQKGVHALLDAVGGNLLTVLLSQVAPFGRVILYGLLDKNPVQFQNATLIFNNITLQGFGVDAWLQSITPIQKQHMYADLIAALQETSFQMPVAATYTFAQFKEALEAYSKGHLSGKLLWVNNGE